MIGTGLGMVWKVKTRRLMCRIVNGRGNCSIVTCMDASLRHISSIYISESDYMYNSNFYHLYLLDSVKQRDISRNELCAEWYIMSINLTHKEQICA